MFRKVKEDISGFAPKFIEFFPDTSFHQVS